MSPEIVARAAAVNLVRGPTGQWWAREGQPSALVGFDGQRWWWAPETWSYNYVVHRAPRFEDEAEAVAAACEWLEYHPAHRETYGGLDRQDRTDLNIGAERREFAERLGGVCTACLGSGLQTYGNTSTWRHGVGGQAMTPDVCDRCWGSGSVVPWPSRRSGGAT